MHEELPPDLEALATIVVDAAFKVHKALGPGLLESAYQSCMEIELRRRNVEFASQATLPIEYEGERVAGAFRTDMVVGRKLLVELKAVESILPVHRAQVLTYLRLTGMRLGLLINFNVPLLKDGIKRVVL